MYEPVGDTIPSLAMDDLLLIATLGEYMLPPYTLVLRLDMPPYEPTPRPRPRPNPCWLGRNARGMNINDRSI